MHVRRWMAAGLMLGVLVLARVGGARAEAGRPRIGLGMLVNLGDAPMAIGGAATLRLPVGPLTVGVEADQILLSGSGPTPADATSGSMTRAAVLAGLSVSLWLDTPTGASIVVCAVAAFILSFGARRWMTA